MKNGKYFFKVFGLLTLCLLFDSCIEMYDPVLEMNDSQPLLVVECLISNEPGPFRAQLSRSVPVDVMAFSDPELGADVQIFDDKGNAYKLYEIGNGWYETDDKNLSGVVGNVYTLAITTSDGNQYESSPEVMLDVPPIDSVYYTEITKTNFESGSPVDEIWVEINANTKTEGDDVVYFRWGYTETWQVETLTTNITVTYGNGANQYTAVENIMIDEQKRTCWVTNNSNSINIGTNENIRSNLLENITVNSIGPQNERIFIRYSILAKQYSITKKLYHYFKELKESNENTGGIYEKNPALLKGNIECCEGNGLVVGYFSASAVKTKRLFISPYDIEAETRSAYSRCMYHSPKPRYLTSYFFGYTEDDSTSIYSINNICADCRYYGTTTKPDFWE